MHEGIIGRRACLRACLSCAVLTTIMTLLMVTGVTKGETPYTLNLRCRHADLRREIRLLYMTSDPKQSRISQLGMLTEIS